MKAKHLIITGRVQGVGYRDWLVHEARRLGHAGWVRNAGTDKVEALIAGDTGAVEECLRNCRLGPPAAAVHTIIDNIADPPEEPGFIKRASIASL
jgi:acylphosphatase